MRNPRSASVLSRLVLVAGLSLAWGAAAPSAAAADAPGTCGAISTTSPNGSWVRETISSSTDVDWYRFSLASGSRTIVTLGRLPADYDLYLYSGCSTLVASAHRSGTRFDEITRYLGAGTYRVKVVGYAGAHSASEYALRFRPIPWGIPILSSATSVDASGYLHVFGEVINNTAEHRRWIEIDATLLDSAGGRVGSALGYADVATLAPYARSPFEIVTRLPSGYARTSLRVCTPNPGSTGCLSGQTAPAALAGLRVAAAASYLDAAGARHYPGTVTNGGTARAYLTRALVTLYDGYGNVRGLGGAPTSPSTIAAGGSATFDVKGAGTTTPNDVRYAAQASPIGCSSAPRYATAGAEDLKPPLTRTSAAGRVALTFDMGGRMTPAVRILNTLVANRVCATIFPTGRIAQTTEGQAALGVVKAHRDLFELANHTMHHCDLVRGGGGSPGAADAAFCESLAPSPTAAEVQKELTDADAIITAATGMATKPFWRAPYRSYNSSVLTWAAQVGWTKQWNFDIDTIDWKPISAGGPTAEQMIRKVVNNAKSGSVVLMHLGGYETLDALQPMIDGLRSRGFVLTTLSDIAA